MVGRQTVATVLIWVILVTDWGGFVGRGDTVPLVTGCVEHRKLTPAEKKNQTVRLNSTAIAAERPAHPDHNSTMRLVLKSPEDSPSPKNREQRAVVFLVP